MTGVEAALKTQTLKLRRVVGVFWTVLLSQLRPRANKKRKREAAEVRATLRDLHVNIGAWTAANILLLKVVLNIFTLHYTPKPYSNH